MDGYDLIGDIHGHAQPLRALLGKLGYRERLGCYRHPHRQVIFLGDLIDRGSGQREVLDIVRRMVEEGQAQAVMGNHELNALAYHTRDPDRPGHFLRERNAKNTAQHQAFLDEHELGSQQLQEALGWFHTLPLWLELEGLRVIHAAWHPESLAAVKAWVSPEHQLTPALLVAASREDNPLYQALETLLKGVEVALPDGMSYQDKEGHVRHNARIKWWLDARQESWRSMAFLPAEVAAKLPDAPLPAELRTGYPQDAPPVFIGHYWLSGEPAPVAPNVACLDYSIAKPGGKLVAYRWEGEARLSAAHYIAVQ